MAGLFKQQIQRKSPQMLKEENKASPQEDGQKSTQNPQSVFNSNLLKVLHMSNEKKRSSCLGYMGYYTTKLHRDFSKPVKGIPMNQPV